MSTDADLSLKIISDTICPWCYIGKRRLEGALALLEGELVIDNSWHPFELNPDMPAAGIDRRDYRIGKFGSWEHSLQVDAQVAQAGARLDDAELRASVKTEAAGHSRSGINGVPSGMVNGYLLFSSASPAAMLADTLRAAMTNKSVTAGSER